MSLPESLYGQAPTDREMRVIALLARGSGNPRIAFELNMASKAVTGHLARIGAKLGTDSRAGIVGAAIRGGHLVVPVTGSPPAGFNEALFDVLVRVARGLTNSRIAAELVLSPDTVKTRMRRLLAVLEVGSREEAVVAGVACGALPLVPVRRREPVPA